MKTIQAQQAIVALTLLVLFSLTLPSGSYANTSFTVKPVITALTATNSGHIQTITITNLSDHQLNLNFQIQPFKQNPDGSAKLLLTSQVNNQTQRLLKQIFILDQRKIVGSVSLEPQQTKTLTIQLPSNNLLKIYQTYYFTIITSSQPGILTLSSPNQITAIVSQKAAIASLFFISPFQPEKNKLYAQFNTPSISFSPEAPYSLSLSNTDRTFAKIQTSVNLHDIFGRSLSYQSPSIWYINDHGKRTVIPTDNDYLKIPASWFGPIQINFTLYNTLSRTNLVLNRTIWIIPLKIASLIIALFIIFVIILIRVKSNLRIRQQH
ncbi:MAG TPA: hypothetical protein VMR41_01445 [Patescibacteria group bacterium]|nr:hypothetical protein [Patescibacteria group bacterium]